MGVTTDDQCCKCADAGFPPVVGLIDALVPFNAGRPELAAAIVATGLVPITDTAQEVSAIIEEAAATRTSPAQILKRKILAQIKNLVCVCCRKGVLPSGGPRRKCLNYALPPVEPEGRRGARTSQ